ncbi:rhodanese-like domain-containing protein [Mucisphaera calidilacus]|uniref:Molybdopterin biosynthesis protein MoeB n=1 Tax=Mucisphaera calidilacus TaxID=2527982 RepID=A0A518BX94_9BACT|nr:rhodanese-like domain-containing protein [Mucisphaera calidilacus]QDU71593.1 molybdopterin biosynthesis protein MoeB [Mucisphaera calidilacus]
MKTSNWLNAALILLATALVGCSSGISDRDLRVVSVKTVLRDLDKHDDPVLVDVRTQAEFEAGHLPNARHLPLQDVQRFDPQLTDADVIIVYGSGWKDDRVPAVVKRLLAYEYNDVYDFRGGYPSWLEHHAKNPE